MLVRFLAPKPATIKFSIFPYLSLFDACAVFKTRNTKLSHLMLHNNGFHCLTSDLISQGRSINLNLRVQDEKKLEIVLLLFIYLLLLEKKVKDKEKQETIFTVK